MFSRFFSKPVILCLNYQKLSGIDHSTDFTILMANTGDHPVKVTGQAQQRGPERWKDQIIILKVISVFTQDRSDYILNRNMTIF